MSTVVFTRQEARICSVFGKWSINVTNAVLPSLLLLPGCLPAAPGPRWSRGQVQGLNCLLFRYSPLASSVQQSCSMDSFAWMLRVAHAAGLKGQRGQVPARCPSQLDPAPTHPLALTTEAVAHGHCISSPHILGFQHMPPRAIWTSPIQPNTTLQICCCPGLPLGFSAREGHHAMCIVQTCP